MVVCLLSCLANLKTLTPQWPTDSQRTRTSIVRLTVRSTAFLNYGNNNNTNNLTTFTQGLLHSSYDIIIVLLFTSHFRHGLITNHSSRSSAIVTQTLQPWVTCFSVFKLSNIVLISSLAMAAGKVLVYGGKGALGSTCISFLSSQKYVSINYI